MSVYFHIVLVAAGLLSAASFTSHAQEQGAVAAGSNPVSKNKGEQTKAAEPAAGRPTNDGQGTAEANKDAEALFRKYLKGDWLEEHSKSKAN